MHHLLPKNCSLYFGSYRNSVCILTRAFLAALQRHYAVLQALALDEDEMPEIKDETLPDEEGMAR